MVGHRLYSFSSSWFEGGTGGFACCYIPRPHCEKGMIICVPFNILNLSDVDVLNTFRNTCTAILY